VLGISSKARQIDENEEREKGREGREGKRACNVRERNRSCWDGGLGINFAEEIQGEETREKT